MPIIKTQMITEARGEGPGQWAVNTSTVPKMTDKDENTEEEKENVDGGKEDDGKLHIVPIEGNGDCFYAAIVEAFKRGGKDFLTNLAEAEVKNED